MAAFDPATLERWRALAIVDRDGTTVGTISEFYLDRETGHPTWALVETGLFGATQTFVPLVHATEIADGLQVPYEKRHIKDSPRVDAQDELTPDEEARLFAHYGVDYEPGVGQEVEAPEGPGPVPVDAATEQAVEPVPDFSGTAEAPEPVPPEPGTTEGPEPVPGEPGTTEAPGPVPEEPGTTENPGPVLEEPGTTEGPETAAGSSGTADDQGAGPSEPGSADPPASDPLGSGAGPGEPGSAEPLASDPLRSGPGSGEPGSADPSMSGAGSGEPGSAETFASDPLRDEGQPGTVSGEPGTAEGPGRVPPEVGTSGPDDATLIVPGEFGSASDHPDGAPDPDLSRTAPVEPGLPGSTAASPGSVPTTVDKDAADLDSRPADASLRDPDDQWPPAPAGSFDEPPPVDRPVGASDRWREAKLAAERERLARAAAAQSEERSPLERARRRLERLVGVGQDHSDDDLSSDDREAAERARRARLGFEDDDPRFR